MITDGKRSEHANMIVFDVELRGPDRGDCYREKPAAPAKYVVGRTNIARLREAGAPSAVRPSASVAFRPGESMRVWFMRG